MQGGRLLPQAQGSWVPMLACPHLVLAGLTILETWWPGSLFLRLPLHLAEGISTWVILLGPWACLGPRAVLYCPETWAHCFPWQRPSNLPQISPQVPGRGEANCLLCQRPQTPQYFTVRIPNIPPPSSATKGKGEENVLRTYLLPSLPRSYQLSSLFPPDPLRGSPCSKEVQIPLTSVRLYILFIL